MSKTARPLDWNKVQRRLGIEAESANENAVGEPQLTGEMEHPPCGGQGLMVMGPGLLWIQVSGPTVFG